NGSPAWSTVYIYVYDANTTEPCGAWPGTVMTSANGSWTFTVNSDVELTSPKVIFNDGAAESTASDQTSAFDLVSGDTYTRDGDTNAATQTWTVTFTDDGSPVWSSVYAYIWDDNNSHPLGDWPGTAMTSAGNNTWTLTFETKYDLVNPLIIFDDGESLDPTENDETDPDGMAYVNGGIYNRETQTGTDNSGSGTENGGSGTENGGTETGINGVAAPGGADVIYTLQGMKVTNTSKKGVYIINGRKVVK
ncbi:MAG: starch-binding protein, partial [Prevotella sp.]|nr:starch-binding protein [Prevotella sp.]